MVKLHPEILKRDGKEQFVVLPYEEYTAFRDLIEDAEDLLALRKAKEEDAGEPGVSLNEMMRRFGMTPNRPARRRKRAG
jgi:hypothetical protein